jgi:hypothetical protein
MRINTAEINNIIVQPAICCLLLSIIYSSPSYFRELPLDLTYLNLTTTPLWLQLNDTARVDKSQFGKGFEWPSFKVYNLGMNKGIEMKKLLTKLDYILFLPLLPIAFLIAKAPCGWIILCFAYLYILILPFIISFVRKDQIDKRRSLGTTLLGFLLVYPPIERLLLSFIVWKFSFPFKRFIYANIKIYYSDFLSIIIVFLYIFLGIEILRLKNWARKCILWFSAIELFLTVGSLLHLLPSGSEPVPLWIVIWCLVKPSFFIWFLTRHKIKEQFR